ncbi:hypothetical protein R1flu_010447 [Riccia fluitans]|uniref:Uncharacterized protein n=1 Tax=Riccia fluitans TaxID=41844 RepID=A0ABD1Z5T2_9MARC
MYDLFGTSSKIIGIPNASDNGQTSQQNVIGSSTPTPPTRQVDLNVTLPHSTPRSKYRYSIFSFCSPGRTVDTGDLTENSVSPQQASAVRGQRMKPKKSLARQREMAAALRGFTEVYKEAKKAKQDTDNKH